MPTENRRVAAYLPKDIDARLKTFKAERGLKGDSVALLAILSEFFGMSQEVVHSSESQITDLLKQVEGLISKVNRLESELLCDLKSGPLDGLKGELLSELQSELFGRLKPDLKSELLGELRSELLRITSTLPTNLRDELQEGKPLNTPEVALSLAQLDLISAGDSEGELPSESLEPDLADVNQSSAELALPSNQDTDQVALTDSELPSGTKSKPLDGSVAWSGVELSKRLIKAGRSEISKRKNLSEEDFAEWTRNKDPDRIAWRRVEGKFVPIVDASEEF